MGRSLPKAPDCRRMLRRAEELELSSDAIQKLKWFLYCAEHYYNVSLTCRHFGISRSTFLRWAHRFNPEIPASLEEVSRRPHTVRQSETNIKLLEYIAIIRKKNPMMGKMGVTAVLEEQYGMTVSSATVGRIITRFGLFFADTESHIAKRHAKEELPEEMIESVLIENEGGEPESDTPTILPLPDIAS